MNKKTLVGLFLEQAGRFPERLAIVHNGQSITYAELKERVQHLGMFLFNECALAPEQLVGIHGSRSIDSIVGILAILLAGGAYVPLPADWPEFRKRETIKDAGLQLVITDQSQGLRGLEKVRLISVDEVSHDKQSSTEKLPDIKAEQLAYVMYTSGSTGQPKGVMIEHRNVLAMLNGFEIVAPHRDPLVGLGLVSIGFDVSVWEIFSILCFGGTLHLVDHPEMVSDLARYLCDRHITSAYLPPLLLSDFVRELKELDCKPDLDRLLVGVEPITQNTLQQFLQVIPDLRVINAYGPTETAICATFYPFKGAKEPERRTPIGKAIQDYVIHLVDDQFKEVSQGDEGEMLIGGAGLGRGYFGDPQLTASKFIPDPFSEGKQRCFRTGDFARRLPDGDIEFIGRKDQQIKVSGYRVELGEIEVGLRHYPLIKQAVVVLKRNAQRGRRILAYYTTSDGQSLDEADLREFLRSRLPAYMQPNALIHMKSFPLTANGKIDRQSLPELAGERKSQNSQPATKMEKALIEIFEGVFQINDLDVQDNFYELNGNSLQAANIIMQINQKLHLSLSIPEFYEHATVKDLADWLASGKSHGMKSSDDHIPPCGPILNIPLSYSQERMWFLAKSEPDNPSLHSSFALRFSGELDASRLKKSLELLISQHAILQTVFYEEGGVPYQRIIPDVDLPFRQIDLTDSEDPLAELRLRITDLNLETFDIGAAPPYRLVLYKIGRRKHVLAVIIHHIIIDGWSSEIFKHDLLELYEQNADRANFSHSRAPISYADYACWQHSEEFNQRIEPQLNYWQDKLKGYEQITRLPDDKPRPISLTSNASTVWLKISGELLENLHNYSKERNTTQFVVLLSAFCAALNRHIQQDIVQLGSFFADRPLPEMTCVMGPFVNGIVLKIDLSGDPDFNELVARARNVVIEAQQNQEAPIEKVVERMKARRDRSQRTMFGIVFNFVNIPVRRSTRTSLKVDNFEFETGTVTYDLNVEFNQSKDRILFAFEYNTDIYQRQTIERFSRHFKNLLKNAISAPGKPISEYEFLPYKELEQIKSWRGISTPYPRDIPVQRLFEDQVRKTPKAVAVMLNDEKITYGALNQRANRLARVLVKNGLKSGDFAGLYISRSIDMISAMLAVIKAGAVYLPLDPSYPKEHLNYILQDAKPALVLCDAANRANLSLDQKNVICVDDLEDQIRAENDNNLEIEIGPRELVYCIYTSGSTGRPKGVLVEHRSLVNFTVGAIKDYGIKSTDRILQFASLNFDTSLEEIFPALCSGAALVLRTSDMLDSISHFIQCCRDWGVTISDLPTAFWHELVMYLEKSGGNLPKSLRLIIIGGERVSPAHLSAWHKLKMKSIRLDNTYGLTECTCVVTRCELTPLERSLYAHREVTIGKAVDNVRLYVLDDRLHKVPVGVPGQLYVGGDCQARGYLNLPDLTAERFIADPFAPNGTDRLYRTGDLVQWRPDGTLEYLGRGDEQIKIRGFRVEPGEIESVMMGIAGVKDAIVIKRSDPSGTDQLLAYLLAEDGAQVAEEDLKKYLAAKLPKYMLPAYYQILPEFPLSPNRKIDKNALPDPDWGRLAGERVRVAPETPGEEKMLAIWEEALGRKGIGVEDNFFEIGGHSLLAARMMTEVERQFGVPIPLVVLLEKPTIRELSKAIMDSGWKPSWRSIVSMKASGSQPPLFLVHAIGGDILSYRRLVIRLQDLDRPIYGIRAQGLGGDTEPLETIEEIAAFYLKELKEIQPHGPYFMGGYSFGGTVAYEMAQQLVSSGEEVALLAMFDTVVMLNLPDGLRPSDLVMLVDHISRVWFVFKKWLGLSLPKKRDYLKKAFEVIKDSLTALIHHEQYLNPQEQADHERWLRKPPAFQKVEKADRQALVAYITKPYSGRITFFKARQREWSEMVNPKPLWRKLALGGLDIFPCNGNHTSILMEPYVKSLAFELKKALTLADNEVS